MSDTAIIISRPLELRIELIELEDDYFRAEVTFQKTESWSTTGGKARVLFAKRDWLAFKKTLGSFYLDKPCGPAILTCCSFEFTIRVERKSEGFLFRISYRTRFSSSDRRARFQYSETVDDDVFGAFRSAFEEFPLWKGERY